MATVSGTTGTLLLVVVVIMVVDDTVVALALAVTVPGVNASIRSNVVKETTMVVAITRAEKESFMMLTREGIFVGRRENVG
jgi:hypothetical protein